jgi:hypothetical protein
MCGSHAWSDAWSEQLGSKILPPNPPMQAHAAQLGRTATAAGHGDHGDRAMKRSEAAAGQVLRTEWCRAGKELWWPSGNELRRPSGNELRWMSSNELRRRTSSENRDYWQVEGARGDGAREIQAAAVCCPGGRRWEVPGGGARGTLAVSMGAPCRWLSGPRTGSWCRGWPAS